MWYANFITFDFGGLGGDIEPDDIDSNYANVSNVELGQGRNVGTITYYPEYYDNNLPTAPYPYAEFGYKFLGWYYVEEDRLIAPTDYTNPESVYELLPKTVANGDMTFVAKWNLVKNDQKFPDKIPSVSHVDSWWDDYGIVCYAASNGDTPYFVGFSDWFWGVYRTVGVGFGTKGDWEFVADFTKDAATWRKGNSGEMAGTELSKIPFAFTAPDGNIDSYGIHDDVAFDAKYTSGGQKDYNFGNLKGLWFNDPFGSGAKQAWLGAPVDLFDDNGNSSGTEPQNPDPGFGPDPKAAVSTSQSGNNVTITVKDSSGKVVATKVVLFEKNKTVKYDVNGYNVEVVYNGSGAKSVKIIA